MGSTRSQRNSLFPAQGQVDEEASTVTNEVTFSGAGGVTVAAILHLLRLLSAELVLTRGLDIDRFEAVARKKLEEFTSPTANRHAHDAGLAFAHQLVEQVLVQIRAQAELKKRLSSDEQHATDIAQPKHASTKLLN
jgi:hypothetical protein